MSKATIVGALIYFLGGAACATGGQNGDDRIDASTSSQQDASHVVSPDAAPPRDAAVSQQQDAQVVQVPQDAPQSGLFCTANNQCTNSGECCLTLGGPSGFCAPGQVVLGQCVPQ
jgi:hypothetical protein